MADTCSLKVPRAQSASSVNVKGSVGVIASTCSSYVYGEQPFYDRDVDESRTPSNYAYITIGL